MKSLPDDLIHKIMLYNSSPTADIIKEYWRTLDKELNLFHDVEGFATDEELHYRYVRMDHPRAYFRRDAMKIGQDDISWIRYSTEFLNLPRLTEGY